MRSTKRLFRKIFLSFLLFCILLNSGWFPLQISLAAIAGSPESALMTANSESDWNLMLVNHDYRIPDDYTIELHVLANGESIDSRIYPFLQEMFDDMRESGIYPTVSSGYRSIEAQQQLLDEKTHSYQSKGYPLMVAQALAARWVAQPGSSEHQLGLAVDINQEPGKSTAWEVYLWLEQNAWQYGFIYRYPPDKTDLTGFENEPWHYRFVGTEAAAVIQEKGICLEEYLDETSR